MAVPDIQFHADSMGANMAELLAEPNRLGVPVLNSSTGGESIQTVLTGVKQTGMGTFNILRAGHQEELRLGKVQFIIDTMAEIVSCSPGKTLVLQQSINKAAAYGTIPNVSGWRDEISDSWADSYGPMYFPITDRMNTRAFSLHSQGTMELTDEELEDISVDLLIKRWRAPRGNDGHMSDSGKIVCANVISRYIRKIGAWPVA